jgi:type VI secretion system Hcp family effector
MAYESYVKVKGFDGQATRTGVPKASSLVYSFNHEISTPYDFQSANAIGRRTHSEIVVRMPVDASVYQYYAAIVAKDKSGYTKLEVEFGFFRMDQKNKGLAGYGDEKPYLTYQIKDAIITYVGFSHDALADVGQAGKLGVGGTSIAATQKDDFLTVKFAYRAITVNYADGNKIAEDSWDGAK